MSTISPYLFGGALAFLLLGVGNRIGAGKPTVTRGSFDYYVDNVCWFGMLVLGSLGIAAAFIGAAK